MWRWLQVEIAPPEFDRAVTRAFAVIAPAVAAFAWVTGLDWRWCAVFTLNAVALVWHAWRDWRAARLGRVEPPAIAPAPKTGNAHRN